MIYLLIVSLVWGLSFGLIKGNLTDMDPYSVAFLRLVISFIIFIPFLRPRLLPAKTTLMLILTGTIQYGLMYAVYIYAFQYLLAWQVALFTIFTPLYVTLIYDVLHRHIKWFSWFSALMAVLGAAVIVFDHNSGSAVLTGFLLVQLSNICFAFGQVFYRHVLSNRPDIADYQIFAWLYGGAVVLTGILALPNISKSVLDLGQTEILSLLYLGVIASGICFFLWNLGARKTSSGTLAVFNNLKIPLAVFFAVLIFGEDADWVRLLCGSVLIVTAIIWNEWYRIKHKNGLKTV